MWTEAERWPRDRPRAGNTKTTGHVLFVMARGRHRDRLLDEGLRLFAQRGFAGTGVQEIADAGGIPKGSFYNYFASKDEFGVAVVERYGACSCQEMAAALSGSGSPIERLKAAFRRHDDTLVASGFAGGCLAGRLAQELAGEQPVFRAPLEKIFREQRRLVADLLAQAAAAGEIAAVSDVETLAGFLLSAWQGAMLRAKAAGSARPLEEFHAITFARLLAPPIPAAR